MGISNEIDSRCEWTSWRTKREKFEGYFRNSRRANEATTWSCDSWRELHQRSSFHLDYEKRFKLRRILHVQYSTFVYHQLTLCGIFIVNCAIYNVSHFVYLTKRSARSCWVPCCRWTSRIFETKVWRSASMKERQRYCWRADETHEQESNIQTVLFHLLNGASSTLSIHWNDGLNILNSEGTTKWLRQTQRNASIESLSLLIPHYTGIFTSKCK